MKKSRRKYYVRKINHLDNGFKFSTDYTKVLQVSRFFIENNIKAFYALSHIEVNSKDNGLPWIFNDAIYFTKETDRNLFLIVFGDLFKSTTLKQIEDETFRKNYY